MTRHPWLVLCVTAALACGVGACAADDSDPSAAAAEMGSSSTGTESAVEPLAQADEAGAVSAASDGVGGGEGEAVAPAAPPVLDGVAAPGQEPLPEDLRPWVGQWVGDAERTFEGIPEAKLGPDENASDLDIPGIEIRQDGAVIIDSATISATEPASGAPPVDPAIAEGDGSGATAAVAFVPPPLDPIETPPYRVVADRRDGDRLHARLVQPVFVPTAGTPAPPSSTDNGEAAPTNVVAHVVLHLEPDALGVEYLPPPDPTRPEWDDSEGAETYVTWYMRAR